MLILLESLSISKWIFSRVQMSCHKLLLVGWLSTCSPWTCCMRNLEPSASESKLEEKYQTVVSSKLTIVPFSVKQVLDHLERGEGNSFVTTNNNNAFLEFGSLNTPWSKDIPCTSIATLELHLGFSAKLRIWQVPACKMEPRSGYIMQLEIRSWSFFFQCCAVSPPQLFPY